MKKGAKTVARELTRLAVRPDREIDTSDIPEIADWSQAVVGRFYRPVKKAVTLRLDADVLAWLKREGKGYQTRINEILRREMGGRSQRSGGRRG